MGAGVLVAGMYGGYFGAAQGVLLMGILSALSTEPLQRLNGYKNVLALVVNVVAAAVFVLFARDEIDWLIVVLIGVGAFVGGIIGAHVGRRIPPTAPARPHRRHRCRRRRQAGLVLLTPRPSACSGRGQGPRTATTVWGCRSRSPTPPTRGSRTTSR